MGFILSLLGGPVWGFVKAFWKPLAIALSVLLVVGVIHHHGYSSGVTKTEKKYTVIVAKANAERDSAKAALVQTESAFEALKKEDARIKKQQDEAIAVNAKRAEDSKARIDAIRKQQPVGKTEEEQLRDLIRKQAKP